MDTQKIGKFLRDLRKENNMTQEQLGERIGVTNKTVSRWETGSYLPPVECLNMLSEIYQISINEILAGERVEKEKFKDLAEENISKALEEIEAACKKTETKLYVTMIVNFILTISVFQILPIGSTSSDKIRSLVVVLLIWAIALISNSLSFVALILNKERIKK